MKVESVEEHLQARENNKGLYTIASLYMK